jgi:sugar phosphate isomerase/epimerase
MSFHIALQTWTIREQLNEDYYGSFTKVAEIGYEAVEVGMPPEGIASADMKAHFDRIGLHALSCHANLEQLTKSLDELIDFVKMAGSRYIVLSYYRFGSREEVMEIARLLNQIGQSCLDHGIRFLYHNHDWEFMRFDGEHALDLLLEATDPKLVGVELDVYWVKKAGVDPVSYLRKLDRRCPLLHVKDMEPGEEQWFAEVGEGILPMKEIIEAATEVGTEWLVVEQDSCRRPPFDCIATSYDNLQKMGVLQP